MRKGVLSSPHDLVSWREDILKAREQNRLYLSLCAGPGCQACNCQGVLAAIQDQVKKFGDNERPYVRATGCQSFCEEGPLLEIMPLNIFYTRVCPEDVAEIFERTVARGEIIDRLLYQDPGTGKRVAKRDEILFYRKQSRLLLDDIPFIDPANIEDYIALGGYGALAKALFEVEPEGIIEEIKRSGLRGRGGAGFPTGRKWEACRQAEGDEKYVICNADEGDPGAYMDRGLLEGNPHAVIEGMIIGARAIGAGAGFVYVRNEYPFAVKSVRHAVEECRNCGLLGVNILGSGMSFDICVVRGGGAFVCGESTALMASIEGKPGEPRDKHIHTVRRGLWNKPSNLNNVETWANVPKIILNGADWFASIGTPLSKGTKIFSLVGKVKNTGLVEVPMGIPLRDIVFDIGGGPLDGKGVKAVQTGGPSGGCLPAGLFDLPVDFEHLTEAGSMMGSGGLIVMDEATCMVDVALYFLRFLQDESCGKCTPCTLGLHRMVQILERVTRGEGSLGELELLQEVAEVTRDCSLCGLGKTATNPVLSTLRYFFDEYRAHIEEKKCPAGVCRALVTYQVESSACTSCGVCEESCLHGAIIEEVGETYRIDAELCTKCGACLEVCPSGAIVRF